METRTFYSKFGNNNFGNKDVFPTLENNIGKKQIQSWKNQIWKTILEIRTVFPNFENQFWKYGRFITILENNFGKKNVFPNLENQFWKYGRFPNLENNFWKQGRFSKFGKTILEIRTLCSSTFGFAIGLPTQTPL